MFIFMCRCIAYTATHFNNVSPTEEDILCLEVSMKDVSLMQVLQCQGYLHKPLDHLRLWKRCLCMQEERKA